MTWHLTELLREYAAPNVFNPWRDADPMDIIELAADARRMRLAEHFAVNPSWILVGEAPGYQGCHFSGIPFTNESLLCAGRVPRMGRTNRLTSRPIPWCEPSATIVWDALYANGIADQVVMWNAFPFHPHKIGNVYSNRTPSLAELKAAEPITRAILEHFAGVRMIAVGKTAAATLRRLDIHAFETVRHPAYGGAPEFREVLARIVGTTKKEFALI